MWRRTLLAAVVLVAAVTAIVAVTSAGAQDSGTKTLRFGWAQDPQTLNPFVDQDDEDFVIWSFNWDLLTDFSPKDLSPVPGVAEKWTTSKDRLTTTFTLKKGLKWSDGKPVTSADVKYSLDTLGGNGLLFTSYVENIDSVKTPDDQTVVIKTSKPDARIVGGLFVYMLPEHIWGKVPVKKLLGSYKVQLPMVGTGPFIVDQFQHGKLLTMKRNPNFQGQKPKFDQIQFIKYGNEDAVERALRAGEVDLIPADVSTASFAKLGDADNIDTVKASSPSFTELSFNLCSKKNCPKAKFNPGVQDVNVRQALAYAIDRERINQIAARNTSQVANGILPQYYKVWYKKPKQSYPFELKKANQLLDKAGYKKGSDGVRSKGNTKLSFVLYTRSESQYEQQVAKLIKEMAAKAGVEFKVQVVSTDKLTELTTQKQGGKPAPDFDTFVWGWGGDPYDPSLLLNLLTTQAIGNSSDSFYSNPTYDKLYDEQVGQFDVNNRKKIIEQMVDISQRDVPYIEMTVDPVLQAYRTDKVSNLKPICPEPDGDIICDEVGYWAMVAAAPGSGGGSGSSAPLIAAIVVGGLILLFIIWRVMRRRGGGGKREAEQLEV